MEVSEQIQWTATSVLSTGNLRDRSTTPKDLGIQQGPWPCKMVGQVFSGDFIQANMGGLRGALKVLEVP